MIWLLVLLLLQVNPLPPGSHISPYPLIYFSGEHSRGIYGAPQFDLEQMFLETGIDNIGIGHTTKNGECVIHIRYYYGRELCWDGQSESFKESFEGR